MRRLPPAVVRQAQGLRRAQERYRTNLSLNKRGDRLRRAQLLLRRKGGARLLAARGRARVLGQALEQRAEAEPAEGRRKAVRRGQQRGLPVKAHGRVAVDGRQLLAQARGLRARAHALAELAL